jgi:hypothetical protein
MLSAAMIHVVNRVFMTNDQWVFMETKNQDGTGSSRYAVDYDNAATTDGRCASATLAAHFR